MNAAPAAVVIGVGNEYRGDDGIGPRLVGELERRGAAARLVVSDGEPAGLLGAWAGAELAIVVDAVLCEPARPGTIHRSTVDGLPLGRPATGAASSHGLGIPDAVRLAEALDRMPQRMVIFAVEAADVGFGVELSPPVAGALPGLIDAVLAELPDL